MSEQLTRSVLKAPKFWGGLAVRAFTRSWGRDVMLYTGGVSFFALLAVFPAIAILIGFYKLGLSISEVSAQAAALSDLLPNAAQTIFQDEIARLSNASARDGFRPERLRPVRRRLCGASGIQGLAGRIEPDP
ncbi:YhjD/YihY/BrkB family envelope integrity protein [Brevundimonas sp.]|uniref:YhjD/YihY/BrkB family envelope integrity protein n=1 Tax=Brevundimonas sp. TaxID=1871086 RepID=UPI003AFFB43B